MVTIKKNNMRPLTRFLMTLLLCVVGVSNVTAKETLNAPGISYKWFSDDDNLWYVELYADQSSIGSPSCDIYYSIDGGEEVKYDGQFTMANGQKLTCYAKADGYTNSPTMTATAMEDISLNYQWDEYYWGNSPITLGDEIESGLYQLQVDGGILSGGHLLTPNENINENFKLSDGLYSSDARTYAISGLKVGQYLYIDCWSEYGSATITPVEGLYLDTWMSNYYGKYLKVTTDGTVRFTCSAKSYLYQISLYEEPEDGYITVADANGNKLTYYYENATSAATFTGIAEYASDENKAGHIIIADEVTDKKGNVHEVKHIGSYLSNRDHLVSVVFGKNIVSVGYESFYYSPVESITVLSALESSDYYAFYGCNSLKTINYEGASVPNSFITYHNKLETINIGKNVKSIGDYAFQANTGVTTLNIDPEVSDLTIGQGAFYNLDSLRTVTLPKGIVSMGQSVFANCDSLHTILFDDESVITAIPDYCFNNDINLQTLTLPNSVQTIGNSAFEYCRNLREITFGTGLDNNGFANDYYLFYNCGNLEKMTLPGVNFPFQCYYYLPNATTLYVNADMVDVYRESNYTNMYHIIPIGAQIDFAITTTEGGQLVTKMPEDVAPNAISLTVSGPINGTDVNWIHQSMPFLQVLNLKDAQIVEGGEAVKRWSVSNGNVTQYGSYNYTVGNDTICEYMFYNMPALRQISLPNGAKSIGEYAISSNNRLEQADLPTALDSIAQCAFYNNEKLAKADIPAGVTTIGQYAFYNTALSSVTIPNGVKRIEYETFYSCNQLKTVTLPDGLEYIGQYAFYGCENIESINIPSQLQTIENSAFAYCYKLASPLVFPITCKSIGESAFYDDYLLEEVTFNEGLESIGSSAFRYCRKIKDVTLPQSLTTLGTYAFSEIDSLKTFIFPAVFTNVPEGILYNCRNVKSVTLAEGTTQIGNHAFNNCQKLATINLNGQPLTTIGNSAFYNTAITEVSLPESLTSLGSSVFSNCKSLETANIPTTITTVPSYTFANCSKLTSATLHDGITVIDYSAFSGCESLMLTALPTALTSIGQYAFQNTKAINVSLTLPETVTTLGYEAFYGSGITGIVIKKPISNFNSYVFSNCTSLTSVSLPITMKVLPEGTFQYTTSLKTITLPDSLKEIGYYAFYGSGLESIILPLKVQTIGYQAFYDTQLSEIKVPKNVLSVGSQFAANCKQLKTAWLGRKQDYTNNYYFDYFAGCDNLELLRVCAGTPPEISSSSSWYVGAYTGYRTNCVLEVPEGQVDIYQETDTWKEFKEIRAFESGEMLNDLDYAVLKELYNNLSGASWTKPWDVSKQNHSNGKWQGVSTEVDAEDDELFYITDIDLTERGLVGALPKSVFTLPRLKTLNLSHNIIEAEVDTLINNENSLITTVNMEGNHLKGDLYPFISKLPNLTNLNVSYNWLTAYSEKTSNEILNNRNMSRGYQFIDWKTKEVVVPDELNEAVVINYTPGIPVDIRSNTLQLYRHEYGDHDLSFSDLYRLYRSGSNLYSSDWELKKQTEGLWDINTSYVFRGPKAQLVAYTHGMPWWNCITYIFRIDWEDGDVNADQTIDVADLQAVVYYALNDNKPSEQMYNFTAADANNDNQINVSDIVGSVNYVLNYVEPEATRARISNKVASDNRNQISVSGGNVTLTNADEVAAMQLTICGARKGQIHICQDLHNQFSVSMRDVDGGVKIVIYSPTGNSLAPGQTLILNGLPNSAIIADARLVDSNTNRLSVGFNNNTTSIEELSSDELLLDTTPIYDLSGRRVGQWDSLPTGIYIVTLNGKQFKVRK